MQPSSILQTYGAAAVEMIALFIAEAVTTPSVEILVQYPQPANALAEGASIGLDGITSITLTRSEEATSNTLDFSVANGDGRYCPSL